MRIAYVSDIHTEMGRPGALPLDDCDVFILAGDIGKGPAAIHFAANYDHPNTIVVAGNHEYYNGRIDKAQALMREAASDLGVHFLENDTVHIAGQTFIGATAWTDYSLDGTPFMSKIIAQDCMNDFRTIKVNDKGVYRKLCTNDCINMNIVSKQYIFDQAAMFPGSVVVTHHAPTGASIDPQYAGDVTNPAYANNWGNDIAYSDIKAWFHGHIHIAADYMVHNTRVLCNPMDYPQYDRGRQIAYVNL